MTTGRAAVALLAGAMTLLLISMAPAPKQKAGAPDPNHPEKEFGVTLANGTKIKVSVFPNPDWPGKVLHFGPYFPKTDANVFSIALNAMWEIYGRQRGSFRSSDASAAYREHIGSIIVYRLSSGAKFCVYPISSDEKGSSLAMMKVWME